MIILDASVAGGPDADGRGSLVWAGREPVDLVDLIRRPAVRAQSVGNDLLHPHAAAELEPEGQQLRGSQYNCGDTAIVHFHVASSSYHPGGVNVVMGDGSVRFVRDSINFPTGRRWEADRVARSFLTISDPGFSSAS